MLCAVKLWINALTSEVGRMLPQCTHICEQQHGFLDIWRTMSMYAFFFLVLDLMKERRGFHVGSFIHISLSLSLSCCFVSQLLALGSL